MKREELFAALLENGVDPKYFDISDAGRDTTEVYVLRPRLSGVVGTADFWVTYYSERGLETSRRDFATEEEACQHFLGWVLSDPTVRRK